MNRKKIAILYIICIFVSLLFVIAFKLDNEVVRVQSEKTYVYEGKVCRYFIDDINHADKYLDISGWFIEPNYAPNYINRQIVLLDNEENMYKLNTHMIKREDVTKAFDDGQNYDNSGFSAHGLIKQIEKNKEYKIGFLYKDFNDKETLFVTDRKIIL